MEIEIYSHTEIGVTAAEVSRLKELAQAALPLVMPHVGPEGSSFVGLDLVEVSLVDDAQIGAVHAEFLEDASPTDVITFHHGELLVSPETALRQAAEHGTAVFEETLLYIIHGLLHLNGHEDASEEGKVLMARLQQEILEAVLSTERH
jgi:probable rRNA maturation factor